MSATDSGTRITALATIAVPVTDQEKALTFYVEQLGFEKRLDVTYGQGERWIEVAPPGAATTIALAGPGAGRQVGIDTGVRFTTEDATADHASLKARGVDVDEVMRWGGPVPPMFYVRDPDGNSFVIVELPTRVGDLPR